MLILSKSENIDCKQDFIFLPIVFNFGNIDYQSHETKIKHSRHLLWFFAIIDSKTGAGGLLELLLNNKFCFKSTREIHKNRLPAVVNQPMDLKDIKNAY